MSRAQKVWMCPPVQSRRFAEKPAYQTGVTSTRWGKVIQSKCLRALGCKSNQGRSRTKRFHCQETQEQHLLITRRFDVTDQHHVFATSYAGKLFPRKKLPYCKCLEIVCWRVQWKQCPASLWPDSLRTLAGETHNETQERKKSFNAVAITEVETS